MSYLLAGAALFGACGAAQAATTWYVRADGGSASQCDGRSDAKYPGSGSNQSCAWSHPFVALPPGGTPRMAGGDTLMIGPGSYKMGVGAAAGAENCNASYGYDCYMAAVPSGPSTSQPTRILGKGYDSGCSAAPELWGNERANTVLNLKNSNNVQMSCLEVTDHSACIEGHVDAATKCQRTSAPFGAWAPTGLTASNSKNVKLQDINIHGLANQGVFAGGLTDWTMERVKIRANGWAGWNGDIGSGSSNAGQILMREVEVSWNGCAEKYPSTDIHACWAQQKGGYGDGLGTAKTGGNWVIEDSMFHHNTSDGLDLLYADGTGSVTVRRVHAEGNAGNQIKTNGTALIENSVVIGNCNYFNGVGSMIAGDHCRAQGNAISAGLMAGQTTTVRYNTVTGEGDCLLLNVGGSSSSTADIHNNALIGRNSVANQGVLTCGHYSDVSAAKVNFAGNLFYNVRSGQCPSGSTCSDPKVKNNTSLDTFDPTPLAGSPLIDRANGSVTVATDHNNGARPVGAGYDIGAIEYGSTAGGGGGGGGTPPSCTRAAPQLAISAPAGSVSAGALLTYDVTVTSKDEAGCSAATFTLGKTLPSGWTGNLAASSLSISPGSKATTIINVTSPSSAAAGTYNFDVSAASGAYSGKTTGAYTIAAGSPPPATCTRSAPRLSLGAPAPASGKAGATLQFPVSLTSTDSSACAAANFSLARTLPAGWSGSFAAASLSARPGATVATTLSVTSATSASAGSYPVQISATSGSYGASASGSYTVTGTTTPPASCTRAAPAVTLGTTSTAVGYGTPVSFSVKVANRDSSGCAASSFNLASGLPTDFTGSFAASRLSVAPGGSASTTITMASPYYTWAAPGGYTFAVTASGNGYSTTAKSSYKVVAPVITLSSNKSTYARGEKMTLTSRITSGGKPVVSNNVRVTITKPNRSTVKVSALTNSSGIAVLSVPLTPSQYPAGSYKLYADGSVGATPVNTSGSFRVK